MRSGSNIFFNNFNNSSEQDLLESLIVESIGIYGHNVSYVPRTVVSKDDIYGEDTISEYNSAYDIDMYIRSYDSYEGEGTFLSKFNLEIRDQITFVVARKTFNSDIAVNENIIRPQEGDLIYSEMMKRLFIIKYVNDKESFYPLGSLPMYDLTCEVFEYSSEKLNTGHPEIDALEVEFSLDEEVHSLLDSNGERLLDSNGNPIILGNFDFDSQNQDTFADNDEFDFENERDNIVDWTEIDPFGENNIV